MDTGTVVIILVVLNILAILFWSWLGYKYKDRFKALQVMTFIVGFSCFTALMAVLANQDIQKKLERTAQLTQINGAWIAADHSLRMHFYSEEKPDEIETIYLVLADPRTGMAQLLPYKAAGQDHTLEFTLLSKISTKNNGDVATPPLLGGFPAQFRVTEFNENSLVLQIQNQALRFTLESRPVLFREYPDYALRYSTEEYLAVVVGTLINLRWNNSDSKANGVSSPLWNNLDIAFAGKPAGMYELHIQNIALESGKSNVLKPGINAEKIMPVIKDLLAPVRSKMEAIYCTETFMAENGRADWTGRYTMDALAPAVVKDTATGKKYEVIRK